MIRVLYFPFSFFGSFSFLHSYKVEISLLSELNIFIHFIHNVYTVKKVLSRFKIFIRHIHNYTEYNQQ